MQRGWSGEYLQNRYWITAFSSHRVLPAGSKLSITDVLNSLSECPDRASPKKVCCFLVIWTGISLSKPYVTHGYSNIMNFFSGRFIRNINVLCPYPLHSILQTFPDKG